MYQPAAKLLLDRVTKLARHHIRGQVTAEEFIDNVIIYFASYEQHFYPDLVPEIWAAILEQDDDPELQRQISRAFSRVTSYEAAA